MKQGQKTCSVTSSCTVDGAAWSCPRGLKGGLGGVAHSLSLPFSLWSPQNSSGKKLAVLIVSSCLQSRCHCTETWLTPSQRGKYLYRLTNAFLWSTVSPRQGKGTKELQCWLSKRPNNLILAFTWLSEHGCFKKLRNSKVRQKFRCYVAAGFRPVLQHMGCVGIVLHETCLQR